jgi:hypothetical protein
MEEKTAEAFATMFARLNFIELSQYDRNSFYEKLYMNFFYTL